MKLERDKLIIIIAIICVIIFGALYIIELNRGTAVALEVRNNVPLAENTPSPIIDDTPALFMVHIVGAVTRPGVYQVESGMRVADVLDMAGGATEEADLNRINLAAYVFDAQQIVIPLVRADGDTTEPVFAEPPAAQASLININTADIRDLMTLPGIGEVIAGNIISHRERNGRFRIISDIKNVPRIGERTFEQIQHLITVE